MEELPLGRGPMKATVTDERGTGGAGVGRGRGVTRLGVVRVADSHVVHGAYLDFDHPARMGYTEDVRGVAQFG